MKLQKYAILALSGIDSQPTGLSDVLDLKTQKLYEVPSWFFANIEATESMMLFFGYGPKKLLANQFAEFFTFDLFDSLILVQGSIATLYLFFFWIKPLIFTPEI